MVILDQFYVFTPWYQVPLQKTLGVERVDMPTLMKISLSSKESIDNKITGEENFYNIISRYYK